MISNHTSALEVLYFASRYLPIFTRFSVGSPEVSGRYAKVDCLLWIDGWRDVMLISQSPFPSILPSPASSTGGLRCLIITRSLLESFPCTKQDHS